MTRGNRREGAKPLLRVQLLAPVLVIPILVLLLCSPLWGQEGEEVSLAIGFMGPDGTTGLAEFRGQVEGQPETIRATAYGIPSEPPEHQLVRLTNQERINNGIPPLKAASELMNSAQYHSRWMANHDCFNHDCPGEATWVQRVQTAGYLSWTALGENLAAGYPTASGVVAAWMSSPGHRNNMLSPDFREAGGGYAFNGGSTYYHYWTLDLGARNKAQGYPLYPVIINDEAWSTTSLQVDLYVHGSGWANQMRFRNEGDNWSGWEPFSANKTWSLDIPLSVQPKLMVFVSEQGSPQIIAAYYHMTIDACSSSLATVYAQIRRDSSLLENSDDIYLNDCCEGWNASANRNWIKLSDYSGSGSANVAVTLEGFPTSPPGTYAGTITVTTAPQEQANVQVLLVVTDGPLEHGYVPLSATE